MEKASKRELWLMAGTGETPISNSTIRIPAGNGERKLYVIVQVARSVAPVEFPGTLPQYIVLWKVLIVPYDSRPTFLKLVVGNPGTAWVAKSVPEKIVGLAGAPAVTVDGNEITALPVIVSTRVPPSRLNVPLIVEFEVLNTANVGAPRTSVPQAATASNNLTIDIERFPAR